MNQGKIEKKDIIEKEMSSVSEKIKHRIEVFRREGILLFAISVGSASISHVIFKNLSLLIAFSIFISGIFIGKNDREDLEATINSIEKKIDQFNDDEYWYRERICEIEILKKKLSCRGIITNNWIYFVCCLFWITLFFVKTN
ncbi:MAG: hypothetical protein LBD10_14145 [Desulfobulbus sp.]|jgi:hypothetical protein|uniref:hypothetical protein n=1 Tax=Desulfobulbus sp. TaxID=895 RepID=UPI00284DEC27|nr:hypothetical protein [Desulfobulbus sp.]MDR2551332.1 hypothetical protein [Desulfobulbus sp.]